jgi:hypothetical protein
MTGLQENWFFFSGPALAQGQPPARAQIRSSLKRSGLVSEVRKTPLVGEYRQLTPNRLGRKKNFKKVTQTLFSGISPQTQVRKLRFQPAAAWKKLAAVKDRAKNAGGEGEFEARRPNSGRELRRAAAAHPRLNWPRLVVSCAHDECVPPLRRAGG